jgi:hypothetical protein
MASALSPTHQHVRGQPGVAGYLGPFKCAAGPGPTTLAGADVTLQPSLELRVQRGHGEQVLTGAPLGQVQHLAHVCGLFGNSRNQASRTEQRVGVDQRRPQVEQLHRDLRRDVA